MKRIIKRIIIWFSLSTVTTVGILVMLILYPQNLFAKKASYKDFTVYSNTEIQDDFKPVLDKALKLVIDSELYEKMNFNILLADNSLYKEMDTRLFGLALARSISNNVILRVHVSPEDNLLVGPKNKRDLTKTVAHELVHCLQFRRYGPLKFIPLFPPAIWILEGYPEYVVNKEEIKSEHYKLTDSIKQLRALEENGSTFIEVKPGQFDPLIYFKGRVMIEYLIDIKKMTYDGILKAKLSEKTVYDEMQKWYTEQMTE